MIVKTYGIDFKSKGGALTLSPSEIGIHQDGWTVNGKIHEDFYEWVNYFEASHPTYGKVWGNFENKVYADTEEAYNHFYKNHSPQAWDYEDI